MLCVDGKAQAKSTKNTEVGWLQGAALGEMMLLPSHPRTQSQSLSARPHGKIPTDRSHTTRDTTGVSRSLSTEARNAIGPSEVLRYSTKIFFIRLSDRNGYGDFLATNCCIGQVGGNPRGDTFNRCFWKSPKNTSGAIDAFKTLKNRVLET